jgi:hypothetical protein
MEMLSFRELIIVGTGLGLASAYTVAAETVKSTELGQTLVVPIRIEEVKAGYDDKQRLRHQMESATLVGWFQHIIQQLSEHEVKPYLLRFLVETIADAWGIHAERLYQQTWTLEIDSDIFWCSFSRKKTVPQHRRKKS